MHKYWKQIAAGSLAVMLATPVPIQAAIKKSIYVGDVVSITAADLKVNKGYKSLSELNTMEHRCYCRSNFTGCCRIHQLYGEGQTGIQRTKFLVYLDRLLELCTK